MQLVGVARLKPWDDCQTRLRQLIGGMIAGCSHCEVRSFDCGSGADRRYQAMLRGEDSVTRYVHFEPREGDFRQMALVLWGLTDREARQWCTGFVGGLHETQRALPEYAYRFSEEGRQLRTLGRIEAQCH